MSEQIRNAVKKHLKEELKGFFLKVLGYPDSVSK